MNENNDVGGDGLLSKRPKRKHRRHYRHDRHHRHRRHRRGQSDSHAASAGLSADMQQGFDVVLPENDGVSDSKLMADLISSPLPDDATLSGLPESNSTAHVNLSSQLPIPIDESGEVPLVYPEADHASLFAPGETRIQRSRNNGNKSNVVGKKGLSPHHRHHRRHHNHSKRVSKTPKQAGIKHADSGAKPGLQAADVHGVRALVERAGRDGIKHANSGNSLRAFVGRVGSKSLKSEKESVSRDVLHAVQEPTEEDEPAEEQETTEEQAVSSNEGSPAPARQAEAPAAKEDTKEDTKEDGKKETKEDTKEEGKEDGKEETKQDTKEDGKEDTKEVAAPPSPPAAAPAAAPADSDREVRNPIGTMEEEERKIDELEDEIKEETHSEGLANMLGSIKMNIVRLNERVQAVHDELRDGVTLEEPDTELIHPLSTTMQCIINLTIQYFLIYTAFAIVCSAQDFMESGNTLAYYALKCACDTVIYAPMLCVLFLGTRMRALQITQGQGDPPVFAQVAMQICTWAVLVQTCLALAVPLFTGQAAETDEDGNVISSGQDSPAMAGLLTLIKYFAMLSQYIGVSVICVAIFIMDARMLKAKPVDMWDNPDTTEIEYAPPVSPAVSCTMNLTVQFFAVYLVYSILATMIQFLRPGSELSDTMLRWKGVMDVARYTVNMAPMLCILFIGARMRALQLDPKHGNPQWWAQYCFYLCTYSVLVQTLMVILVPVMGLAEPEKNPLVKGDVKFVAKSGGLNLFLSLIRFAALLCLYGGFTAVIWSVFVIKAPEGKVTPPVSPTMKCVMSLTVQYFFVYLCLFVVMTLHEHARPMLTALYVLQAAETTVKFCPMLAVLFVGTRMRALELSKQKGSPQCWAQDAMYIATAAVLVQLCLALLLGILAGEVDMDESGNPRVHISWMPGRAMLAFLSVLTFIGLYGGVVIVIVSVLVISPGKAYCAKGGRYINI